MGQLDLVRKYSEGDPGSSRATVGEVVPTRCALAELYHYDG